MAELFNGQALDDTYVQVVSEVGQCATYQLYTATHRYSIMVHDNTPGGYLGCQVSNRMPLAGEDWTRGRDLPDGPVNYDTWKRIVDAILANEFVPLAKMPEHAPVVPL